ncbi:MAG TPA: hydantoinase/oxoprolinase family protein [Thermomicrobiales bacterium]|nr:hydantoinase/oxoprolinase family protein [Thermomicrobiales bacterium]
MKLATDIGGTFTDLVYLDETTGEYFLAKALSTPPQFSNGIMNAIHKSDLDPSAVTGFVHGATVVINALTERKGAKTALVTTEGCRDVLEIGRANRPDIYNMRFRKQPPFVPREWRFEVAERMNYKGEVVTELDLATVDAVAHQIEAERCDSVAICLLHSYANPAHELQVADRLRELLPEVLVTASAEITREWREYERTSTAVLNAYVQPVAASYLRQLESSLRAEGIAAPLDIMKSNGGTSSFDFVIEQPIHLVESGPVGGVIGAAALGALIGEPNLITMDIGGTTAKCSLIENGDYKITTEYRIERDDRTAGYPIKAPVVDIVEIGAGGGSIAWIDAGGALKIGPRSAGASPGPASYGMGGAEPTVTDANLIAGRINPDYFLGGELQLDIVKARVAYQPIADALGVSVDEAAIGVIRLANANMINALKLVSVRRGYDPREFALIAFGGGGSMHAVALARELRIAKVIVPVAPGHFSAFGMMMSDAMQDYLLTALTASEEGSRDRVESIFADLDAQAVDFFVVAGFDRDQIELVRSLDMRYNGQEHTVRVRVPGGKLDFAVVNDRFHAAHEKAYTFRLPSGVEIVNFHVAAAVPTAKPALAELEAGSGTPRLKDTRMVDFDVWGRLDSAVYERADLYPGCAFHGPAIIEEPAASTVVPPGVTGTVDAIGNIVMTLGDEA